MSAFLFGGGENVMKLTEKQKRFVEEYLVDLNATQAYLRAGYKAKNENIAGVEAFKLLRNPKIEESVRLAMENRSKRTEITQDRVLQELAKIGFADIKNYLSFNTALTTVGYDDKGERIVDYATVVQLKDSEEVDGAVISEISLKDGALKFKLHDKMKALQDIGRHLGMFTDKVEHSGETSLTVVFDPGLDDE
jgi:phage terminase small subunit